MTTQKELEKKLWSDLKSDRTIMLALADGQGGDAQPMTVIFEKDTPGPCWIFSSSDVDLVKQLGATPKPATAQFVAKGHSLFATLRGQLQVHNDRAMIDRLWNSFIAAWYDGKDDPKLRLLRLDLEHAHVWLNENSLLAGVKMMLGSDPKKEYKDKTADLKL